LIKRIKLIKNFKYFFILTNSKILCPLENGHLASGSSIIDFSIEIWNTTNASLVIQIDTGYANGVYSLASLENSMLASADLQGNSIEIWNVTNGQLIRQLNGHTNVVKDLFRLKNGTLISA